MNPSWRRWAPSVFNVIGFQITWLACVWGAGKGSWAIGLYAAAAFSCLSFWLSRSRRQDLLTLCIALPIGFMMDSVLAQSGFLRFASAVPSESWAPFWIMALWLGFTMTLNHSLSVVYRNPAYTFLFGFLGGPLAYAIAGLRFDAMQIQTDMLSGLLAIAIVWGIGLSSIRSIDFWLRQRRSARS